MTARVLQFPERGPFSVRVEREHEDVACWLVVAREHAWLHPSHDEALADAEWIASGFGVAVEVNAS
jgi:hypothetical protein